MTFPGYSMSGLRQLVNFIGIKYLVLKRVSLGNEIQENKQLKKVKEYNFFLAVIKFGRHQKKCDCDGTEFRGRQISTRET